MKLKHPDNHFSVVKHIRDQALFAAAAYWAITARKQSYWRYRSQEEMAVNLMENAIRELKQRIDDGIGFEFRCVGGRPPY